MRSSTTSSMTQANTCSTVHSPSPKENCGPSTPSPSQQRAGSQRRLCSRSPRSTVAGPTQGEPTAERGRSTTTPWREKPRSWPSGHSSRSRPSRSRCSNVVPRATPHRESMANIPCLRARRSRGPGHLGSPRTFRRAHPGLWQSRRRRLSGAKRCPGEPAAGFLEDSPQVTWA